MTTPQKSSLSPPPEWWQATATIVGLVGVLIGGLIILPFCVGVDPLGTVASFQALPYNLQLMQLYCISFFLLSIAYLGAALSDRKYRTATGRDKLLPFCVFFGVLVPILPAIVYGLFGIQRLHTATEGWGLIGYRTATAVSLILVPLFNWICTYRNLWRGEAMKPATGFMNGFALVASAMFAATFFCRDEIWTDFPLTCAAMICGMLGAATIAVVVERPGKAGQIGAFGGLVAATLLFVIPQISFEFHSTLVEAAVNNDAAPESRRAAIRMLRTLGNRDDMLRGAYGTFDQTSMISAIHKDHVDAFRNAFYRVHGIGFNEVPPPWDVQLMHLLHPDRDLAGEVVGAVNRYVYVDAHEWTLGWTRDGSQPSATITWNIPIHNTSNRDQEARFEVRLPEGAVVSNAVLVSNGVRRSAIVAPASEARHAYQEVVREMRDPLLVTWGGPDRVLVQCYPVPPHAAQSSFGVELQIAAPFKVNAKRNDFQLELPSICVSSFEIKNTSDKDSRVVSIPLTGRDVELMLTRVAHSPAELKELAIVVDGGAGMRNSQRQIVEALEKLKLHAGVKLDVFFASDEIADMKSSARDLALSPFVGGPDNSAVLSKALDTARGAGHSAVVWLHGPQAQKGTTELANYYTLSDRLKLYDVQMTPGTNVYATELTGMTAAHLDANSLADFLDDVQNPSFYPRLRPMSGPIGCMEEVNRMTSTNRAEAARLAAEGHIVTPFTSALVLETDDDYVRFGFKDEEPENTLSQPLNTIQIDPIGYGGGGFVSGSDGDSFGGMSDQRGAYSSSYNSYIANYGASSSYGVQGRVRGMVVSDALMEAPAAPMMAAAPAPAPAREGHFKRRQIVRRPHFVTQLEAQTKALDKKSVTESLSHLNTYAPAPTDAPVPAAAKQTGGSASRNGAAIIPVILLLLALWCSFAWYITRQKRTA